MVVVLGILAALATQVRFWTPACSGFNVGVAETWCKRYHDAVRARARFDPTAPTTLDELARPVEPGGDPWVDVVDDPWGHPYVLEIAGTGFRVRCCGPDGVAGTEDDIACPRDAGP